jgi:deoxyribodipyrimidine photo-lyase
MNLNERIKLINQKQILKEKDFILYWMSHSHRAFFNPSLEFAIELSNEYKKPLVVYYPLTDKYNFSNQRYYSFMIDGILEAKQSIEDRGIKFALEKVEDVKNRLIHHAQNACCIVTDKAYLKYQRNLSNSIAQSIKIAFFEVESDVCIPIEVASDKKIPYAYLLRNRIHQYLEKFITPVELIEPSIKSIHREFEFEKIPFKNTKDILNHLNIDKSVSFATFKGGYTEAKKYLKDFINYKLYKYKEFRSHPELDFQSHLSPYLHFGQISPVEVVLEVLSVYNKNDENVDSFFNELIVWRELARNFCYYNPLYNEYEGIPDWAKQTLEDHLNDKRDYLYSLEEFEKAKTHDKYWNAAQEEMLKTGKMHNYMRMYWCKKIIEWTKHPKIAFDIACYLNDKYELDGRDPNGYAGISWCFGTHDRPWQERKVFGKIRYMSESGLKNKFDIELYVKKVQDL